jgi:hypothetical protein
MGRPAHKLCAFVKCEKSDPKKHAGPFKLLRVESDGLRLIRCNGCGNAFFCTRKIKQEKPKRDCT